jgi:hypothetical protein
MVIAALLLSSAKTLFRDDFNTYTEREWQNADWKLGRTQFGLKPECKGGVMMLRHETYNPKAPGETFLGTELYTRPKFTLETGLQITAKVRVKNPPPGMVASIFTYSTDRLGSDEIDFEFLSTQTNKAKGDHSLLATNWNDWDEKKELYGNKTNHSPQSVTPKGLNTGEWNVYTIRWYPTKTDWLLNGTLIRSSNEAVPDADTAIRFNFWAAAKYWTEAYSAEYQPTKDPSKNQVCTYEIDYVEIKRLP